ncbi:hypothetical protein ALC56_07843 [Trachymyrmex septentrionalis]|uniref:Uncharacterized protein n=1 Tax=Trachymyrmex septentrionalis TaxID=34720 RepID=A0A195FC69_9HYME|nr:hypothetical protein ALC56_07843 [Trachymyrmex septentrionalis]
MHFDSAQRKVEVKLLQVHSSGIAQHGVHINAEVAYNFSEIRYTRSCIHPMTHFPISGLSVSMSISSRVNGSSGGIPSSAIPLRIRVRNFSRNLFSLNSRPIEAALSTVRFKGLSRINERYQIHFRHYFNVWYNPLPLSPRGGALDAEKLED